MSEERSKTDEKYAPSEVESNSLEQPPHHAAQPQFDFRELQYFSSQNEVVGPYEGENQRSVNHSEAFKSNRVALPSQNSSAMVTESAKTPFNIE